MATGSTSCSSLVVHFLISIMLFQHRRCSLLGIDACPDLESQRRRFLNNGWSEAWGLDMAEVYRLLPQEECTR